MSDAAAGKDFAETVAVGSNEMERGEGECYWYITNPSRLKHG